MLDKMFKSIIDQDRCAIVVCNCDHTIVYMNPAAISRYGKRGGEKLIGCSIKDCHNPHSGEIIDRVCEWFAADRTHNMIYTYHNPKENKDVYMVALRNEAGEYIGYYEKHEYRNAETATAYDFSTSLI